LVSDILRLPCSSHVNGMCGDADYAVSHIAVLPWTSA
jgi:hypothetical protein